MSTESKASSAFAVMVAVPRSVVAQKVTVAVPRVVVANAETPTADVAVSLKQHSVEAKLTRVPSTS